jgi:hypothetical protein
MSSWGVFVTGVLFGWVTLPVLLVLWEDWRDA